MLYSCMLWLLSAMPASQMAGGEIPHLDKVAHFLLYAGFASLIVRAVSHLSTFTLWRVLGVSWALAVGYGVVDEWHQSYVPGRHADPLDLVADALGAAFALFLWVKVQSYFRKKSHHSS